MSKIITPKFRVSYPHVFEARKAPGALKARFSLTALFTDDPESPPGSGTIEEMKTLALAAALEKFGDTEATRTAIRKGKIKMPFLEPDEGKYPDEFTLMMRFASDEKYKPQVVDRFRGPDGKAAVITDPDVLYPGCWARASVRAFAYDTSGNKGVSFALNNVQKLAEGDRLDNRVDARDEFEAEDPEVADGDLGTAEGSEDESLDTMLMGGGKKK